MIQRIQSVYLFVSFLLVVISFFMDWVVYQLADASFAYSPSAFGKEELSNTLLAGANGILGLLIILSVFQFSDRKKQMRSVRIASILAIVVFLVFGAEHYLNIQSMKAIGETKMTYGIATVFPVLEAILCWMAYKRIKKDDDLVRSVDRLR